MSFLLLSCGDQHSTKQQLIAVEPHDLSNTLFYPGTIQPQKTLAITSPADGVITLMSVAYGEHVKENQILFTLSSSKFLADYKAALMQYIKAKNEFNTTQGQLKEAEFLHKNQLISDDEFKTKQSNFYGGQLALIQAKDALQVYIRQLKLKEVDLYQLNIADIEKITQAMHLQLNAESLTLFAPAAGLLLAANKSETESKKVAIGDTVKQGDVLGMIGDVRGLRVRIKVNELTINQLRIGQSVKVTGVAFPEDELIGKIEHLDKQGETANNGLPTFSVDISIPHLTPAQQQRIHVGMSAKVAIHLQEKPQLMLPITAVMEKNGNTVVNKYNMQTKRTETVTIKTGKTTVDSVAILAGLTEGDRVVIPH